MSLGNRKPCEYCWIGPVCKRCNFDLSRPNPDSDVFVYESDNLLLSLSGSSPINVEEINKITFDENNLTIEFTTCDDKFAFKKIFPSGSQFIFYYNPFNIFIIDGYIDITVSDQKLLTISMTQFRVADESDYVHSTIIELLDNTVNDITTSQPFFIRVCTNGEQFKDV